MKKLFAILLLAVFFVAFGTYNDPNGKFTGQYKIDSYPTILGVNEKREVVFIEFGNRPQKSVADYLELL